MALQKRHVVSEFFVVFIFMISILCRICLSYDYDDQDLPYYYNLLDDGMSGNNIDLIEQRTDPDDVLAFKGIPSTSSSAWMMAKTFNVDDYGAKGDGTDDSKAFLNTWKEACSYSGAATTILIPKKKTYRLKPVTFLGPCQSSLTMQISGTLEASDDRSDYEKDGRHWLLFENLQSLSVIGSGTGTINGNGKIWWQNSCKINESLPCKDAPTAVTFYNSNNTVLKNLKIQDAQQIHVSIENCVDVRVSHLTVSAPGDSPNTDGIHIASTRNIHIKSSTIGTGDDCISIETGSRNIQAKDITCGPGHGISIGSLGSGKLEARVSDVTVKGAKLSGTTNGVRIKTWQGGSGKATNIKFQNIRMTNVSNPIIIDQYYCDQDEPCKDQSSAVQIENVVYKNIRGTSASEIAVNFNCSNNHPCQGIVLQNINLKLGGGKQAKAVCNNVDLHEIGHVSPNCP